MWASAKSHSLNKLSDRNFRIDLEESHGEFVLFAFCVEMIFEGQTSDILSMRRHVFATAEINRRFKIRFTRQFIRFCIGSKH